jgi:hypothetical protein
MDGVLILRIILWTFVRKLGVEHRDRSTNAIERRWRGSTE